MMVAVVVPWLTNASAVERIRGVIDAISNSQYELMIFDVESEDRQRRAFELLERGDRADGLLIVSMLPPDAELERLRAANIPCVLVDAQHSSHPIVGVGVDDVVGGEMATRHLIDLGHRRIGFIGDTPPEFRFGWSRDRTRGYERALERAEIDVRQEYVREGTRSVHVARSIATELLQLPEAPTAIFAASDTQALGVLDAARLLGIHVPEELSVVGFDDIEVSAYVGLTTVRQPLFESGRRGAELLLRSLSGRPAQARTELLPLELVVRGTTGPVPLPSSVRAGSAAAT
jgi:DNA-binding LacI/PurR family transcriptional regulator